MKISSYEIINRFDTTDDAKISEFEDVGIEFIQMICETVSSNTIYVDWGL